jgi:hypothetical protein
MTATACPQEVIPERVTVGLWARRSHLPERERVLAFCNDLVMALRNGQMPDVPRTSLGELELSTMTINALRRSGFFYLDEVELLSAEQLCSIHRIGAFSAAEILQAVRRHQRRVARERLATTFEVFPALEPPAPEALQDQARSLIQAFYICTEDQERMAALLLRAADLASGGPAHLRNLAMALLEQPA